MRWIPKRDSADEFKSVFEHWQNLKPWFSPLAIRLLMPWFAIIPILLTILKDVPEIVVLQTNPPLTLTLDLPFRWWLLWLASLLFALGFVLFHLFCPKFVKRYASYVEYRNYEHSPRWLAAELALALPQLNESRKHKLFERLVAKKLAKEVTTDQEPTVGKREVRENATVFAFDFKDKRYLFEASDSPEKHSIERFQQEAFWEIFGRLANTKAPARYIIWLLLLGVVLLVGWAILQSIWSVVEFLLR